eukprot:SM000002S05707  [mRNA]  locus=s2:1750148:1750745:- [translate_table: standard]
MQLTILRDRKAGGFDQLLLDSLYDSGEAQQRALAPATGPAANPHGRLRASAPPPALALMAPPGPDPFAASASIAPPAYVQMALRARQQQEMMAQQAAMLDYYHGAGQMQLRRAWDDTYIYGMTMRQRHHLNLLPWRCSNGSVDALGVRYGSFLVPY